MSLMEKSIIEIGKNCPREEIQTGVSEQQVSDLLSEIRRVIASDSSPNDKDTLRLIREMSHLTRR